MIDLEKIEGFDWDTGNARKSEETHGVSQTEAEQVFFHTPLVLASDPKHSQSEPRFHALGKTNSGRLLHISFTLRFDGRKIRIISARDMHRKERIVYEEKAQTNS
jgi:uncharacterized protein